MDMVMTRKNSWVNKIIRPKAGKKADADVT